MKCSFSGGNSGPSLLASLPNSIQSAYPTKEHGSSAQSFHVGDPLPHEPPGN